MSEQHKIDLLRIEARELAVFPISFRTSLEHTATHLKAQLIGLKPGNMNQ